MKYYRNNLNKLTRSSKTNHYNKFFENNRSNLKKIWDGIKEIIDAKSNYNYNDAINTKIVIILMPSI